MPPRIVVSAPMSAWIKSDFEILPSLLVDLRRPRSAARRPKALLRVLDRLSRHWDRRATIGVQYIMQVS